jgi:haloalkane dehalogenase
LGNREASAFWVIASRVAWSYYRAVTMQLLWTPEADTEGLPGYPFAANYLNVGDADDGPVRMHFVDHGPRSGPVMLLLHGEPSWSYLYRKMIPPLAAAGMRCIAPDLIGFGRSDKPAEQSDYTYARHLGWVRSLLDQLELDSFHFFGQDWGGLLGLRLLAERPERFASACAANTFLPTGREPVSDAFARWREFSQSVPEFPVGGIIAGATVRPVSDEVRAAYDAPFPDESYKAGARKFPLLVPVEPDLEEAQNNQAAWKVLAQYERPFLTLFGDGDPITAGAEKILQSRIPGATDQPHKIIRDAGHFIQEDAGEELADELVEWLR